MSVCLPEEFERNVLGYGKCKWAPGQRLNSAAEVMQALLDGKLIEDDLGDVLQLHNGFLVDQHDNRYGLNLVTRSYCVYAPPKRKVKSERWFAIRKGRAMDDTLYWGYGGETEEGVREAYPNALAYVKAECEVEVDE
jgi:hypothetical protein